MNESINQSKQQTQTNAQHFVLAQLHNTSQANQAH